jgi:SAM-dependent methyltransferase
VSYSDITHFWKTQGLDHVIPNTESEFPEGWDPRELLSIYGKDRNVLEVGCGYGRLCKAFSPDLYLGIDLNPTAIERAKLENPEYTFSVCEWTREYPKSDMTFCYTVLLHVDDATIQSVVSDLCDSAPTVLVAEIMGRKWRRPGDPPVFNREASEYVTMFAQCSYVMVSTEIRPYMRYANTDITFLEFVRKELLTSE